MSEKLGIENIKDVLALPLSLHMAYEKADADGKIDMKDAGYLMGPATKLVPAIQSAKQAVKETKDLDSQERVELMDWARQTYDIADDQLEAKVEAGLDVLLSIAVMVGVMDKAEADEMKS